MTHMQPRPQIARVNVLGVGVHGVNMSQALELVGHALQNGQKNYVCVTGVHGIMEAQKDPVLKAILNSSLLTVPDGMPTVWVGRLQGFWQMRRVFGPDLMLQICAMSRKKGYTHFLYGGAPGVAEALGQVLMRKFPELRIVGHYTPPFRPLTKSEEAALIVQIEKLRPDIFWVGLSTPKQERFMAEYIRKLNTRLMVGVGAAFDVHTGRINDAPDWIKNAGLQWLHRLCQEPTRLWKRYLINNPKFVVQITSQLLGLIKCEPL